MDSFAVEAATSDVWKTSKLVEEMKHDHYGMPCIPVIVDGYVWYFDDLDGGFHDNHLVQFTVDKGGYYDPPGNIGDCFEAHLRGTSYTLWTEDVDWWESEEAHHVIVEVDEYRSQGHTFWKELINGEYK